VCSKADISQLNLQHGTKNYKVGEKEKLKSKKWMCSEVSVNSPGICGVSPKKEETGT